MNLKRIIIHGIGLLIGMATGAFIVLTITTINKKNSEIASLKEQISREQTDRLRDLLKFGQWKLQVDQLAKENGWTLPEMSDTLVIPVAEFEGRISADITGDSIRVVDKSVKITIDKN